MVVKAIQLFVLEYSSTYPLIVQLPVSAAVVSAVHLIVILVGVISAVAIPGALMVPGFVGVSIVKTVDQGLAPMEFSEAS